jgi:superfamily II DNA/RNA helicase
MTFAELNLSAPILKAVADCGYAVPTPIQAQAIPEALAGRDLIGSAGTGTGKTAAFVIPALERLQPPTRGRKGAPRVLILAPTRELAGQVLEAARTYGRYVKLRTAVLLGGMPYRSQFQALAQPLDLIVATPGRLIDHMERGSVDLSALEVLVLDEADRMLDLGFKDDMEKIVAASPVQRQTMLFTATMNQTMAQLANKWLREPVRIDVPSTAKQGASIEQRLHVADNLQHKQRLLAHLATDPALQQAIIFSATKRDADTLARELASQGHRAAALHGDMNQGARNRTLQDLRRGRIKLLVATDVAARGIDISGISHVINFDLPKFAEDYVHRIGRTGRAGATGIAISFVSGSDLGALKRIQHYIGRTLPRHEIPGLEPTRPLAADAGRDKRRSGPPRNRPARSAGRQEMKGGAGKGRRPQQAATSRIR